MRVKIEFSLSSPIVLRGRLYLDAVLLALDVQSGKSYEEAVAGLPVCRGDAGIYRCSQLLWDGLPEAVASKKQMNIWTPVGMDGYASSTSKSFVKSDRKTYKPVMDTFAAMDVGIVYFLAETDDPGLLEEKVRDIPALGKWSRKGYGTIDGVSVTQTDLDPWVLEDQRPARALPVDLWERRYGGGPHALSMERVSPPYWAPEKVLCAVGGIQ